MHRLSRLVFLSALLVGPVWPAADTAILVPLTSDDVPRHTQIGSGSPLPGARFVAAVPVDPALPSLVLIGESSVRCGFFGWGEEEGQWGWGAPLAAFFDPAKINFVNRALGGTSCRTYYRDLWPATLAVVKPGDFVLIAAFGNDGSPINDTSRARGTLKGIGEETEEIDNLLTKKHEVVHTYGWYHRQFIQDIRAKGAIPLLCSRAPSRGWVNGRVDRSRGASFLGWIEQVAQEQGVPLVDLNELASRQWDQLGAAAVDALYSPTGGHTLWDGAVLNAQMLVAGLKGLPENPLAIYFSAPAAKVAAVEIVRKP